MFSCVGVVFYRELSVFDFAPCSDIDGSLGESRCFARFKSHVAPDYNHVGVDNDGSRLEHLGELSDGLNELVEPLLFNRPRIPGILPYR